ncbi:MAG: MFS transporter [Thermodesulfobacteriota bacterium]
MTRINLKWRMLLIVLALTILSQGIFLYGNVRTFQEAYRTETATTLRAVGTNLQENLTDILNKGIPLHKFTGIQALLTDILTEAPLIGYIALCDAAGSLVYYCDREMFLQEGAELGKHGKTPGAEMSLIFDLIDNRNRAHGKLMLAMEPRHTDRAVRAIALDSATIALIAVLATLDLLFFCIAYTVLLPLKEAESDIEQVCRNHTPEIAIRPSGIPFTDLLLDHFNRYRLGFQKQWSALTRAAAPLVPPRSHAARENPGSSSVPAAAARLAGVLTRQPFVATRSATAMGAALPALIRPAVFLFVFAESLSISFLPLFAKDIYQPLGMLSEKLVLGLPISAFMLTTALSMPLGGAWSDRFGRNRTFISGAIISAIGLFLSGTAGHIAALIVYRAVTGLGFGLVFMTAQGFIIDATSADNRAEGMAVFLSAFYGGTLCGSGIGGMLADRIGFRALFHAGALIALAAAFFVHRFTPETRSGQSAGSETGPDASQGKRRPFGTLTELLKDRQFALLTLLQSIPNKICLIGFVYYLAPLWLKAMGNSQSDTGRYIMGYSLCMILFSQALSRWSDRRGHPKPFIVAGGILSGSALTLCYFQPGTAAIAVGILLLGVAHALSVSNQAKLASHLPVMRRVGMGPGMGLYRQTERIGNILAPLLLGLMATRLGYAGSLALLGVFTMLASVLFALVYETNQESPT